MEIFTRLLIFGALGFLLLVFVAILAGVPREYSGAPVENEDDGEEIPEDPDRARDWEYADEIGAW
ncbi:hypothetical protein [Nocardia sp. Marseille-Q1738]